MKCPVCNNEIADNLKFCTVCGANLKAHHCPSCGNELNSNKKFCEKCGTSNPYYSPYAPVSTPQNTNKRSSVELLENSLTSTEDFKAEEKEPKSESIDKDQSESTSSVDEVETIDTSNQSESHETVEDEEMIERKPSHLWITIIIVLLILGVGTIFLGQRLNWWNIPALSFISDSNDNSSDISVLDNENTREFNGMLKAFGLKGKVKTITFHKDEEEADGFTFAFDTDGNLLGFSNYNGEAINKEADNVYSYCKLYIDNWKWTEMNFSGRFLSETSYEMVDYDEYNRPVSTNIFINNEIAKGNVAISYSGSDIKGNYTRIHFDTNGIIYDETAVMSLPYITKTMIVDIKYWPDNATSSDVPTPLAEKLAIELIQKSNRKESDALSSDFKNFIEMESSVPIVWIDYAEYGGDGSAHLNEGCDTPTILSDLDNNNVPDIEVRIDEINISDAGDKATVAFHFSAAYEGRYYESDFSDNDHLWMIMCVYEDGKWKVDDYGWDVIYSAGLYLANKSYKQYNKDNLDACVKDVISGTVEKEIRENFSNDPNMNTYLEKVEAFKEKFNLK